MQPGCFRSKKAEVKENVVGLSNGTNSLNRVPTGSASLHEWRSGGDTNPTKPTATTMKIMWMKWYDLKSLILHSWNLFDQNETKLAWIDQN